LLCHVSPKRKLSKHTPCIAGDRLGASRGIAHRVVRLVEEGAVDTLKLDLGDSVV
jgi:hypothetical protein